MATLEISFYGPFFFNLKSNPVEIYAPKCPGHKAGIFSAKSEWPLHGRYEGGNKLQYFLSGSVFTPPNPPVPPQIYDPNNLILDVSASAKPSYDSAHFCLLVPVPQIVYGINPSKVEIVPTNSPPTGKLSDKATALRFYYDADLSKLATLSFYSNPSKVFWQSDFDSAGLGLGQADLYLRYVANTPEDQDHEDSEHCFEMIAALGGVNSWLCHEDSQHPGFTTSFARAGNDCRAPAMIIK